MLTNKATFIVMTDNIYALDENGGPINSVWCNEDKANARRDELNEKASDEDAWSVEKFYVSK